MEIKKYDQWKDLSPVTAETDSREFWRILERSRKTLAQEEKLTEENEEIVISLMQLRDRLSDRFDYEEKINCLEDPIFSSPHLAGEAQELYAEHESIYGQISDICDEGLNLIMSESRQHDWKKLAERFDQFDQKLCDHEAREYYLIQGAYSTDHGISG